MGVYLRVDEPLPDYLCFTANTAGSTVKLNKYGSPYDVVLETSTDGSNWSTYTFNTAITLSNIGDKVYFRNTSGTTTGFSKGGGNYYKFSMSGSIAASGDIMYLVNKNSSTFLIYGYDFFNLFESCSSLTTPPRLTATGLTNYCYYYMFFSCTNLEGLPELPATTMPAYCYGSMFSYCSKIKLSETQTGQYQTPYRIPITGTGTAQNTSLSSMFSNTGGTYQYPAENTTYYTSNTVV